MKTISTIVKAAKLTAVLYSLLWVAQHAPKAAHASAQQLATTTNAVAQHAADVNEVLTFITK
jgi:hypothetical protein